MIERPVLRRAPDWQSRFDTCIRAQRGDPCSWGRNDCVMFAADCVHAITGIDFAAGQRGSYASEREAARVLARHGGIDALVTGVLGEPLATPRLARVGDVGIVVTAGGRGLAVCTGMHWMSPGEHGLETLPSAAAVKAWRVG